MAETRRRVSVFLRAPLRLSLFGFAQTWFRFELVFNALIQDRSAGLEGPPVPSLSLGCQWLSGRILFDCLDVISDQ